MPHVPKSVPALWRSLRANPLAWELYDKNATLLLLPTLCGGSSLADIKAFYSETGPGTAFRLGALDATHGSQQQQQRSASPTPRHRLPASETVPYSTEKQPGEDHTSDIIKVRKVLKTVYAEDTVIEEAVVDVTLVANSETQNPLYYAWLLPGLLPTKGAQPVTISIVMVNIVAFDLHFGKMLSRRVYWDQASVLEQLGVLAPRKSDSNSVTFHRAFELPLSGKEQADTAQQLSADKLNKLAAKYNWNEQDQHDDDLPPDYDQQEQDDANGQADGSSDSTQTANRDAGKAAPKQRSPNRGRPKSSKLILAEVAEKNNRSHIFDEETLPTAHFSGIAANPKRYESQNGVFGGPQEAETPKERSSGVRTGGKATFYDDRGAIPLPNIRDPEHHRTNIDFVGPKDDAGQVDAYGQPIPPGGQPRTRKISNREQETSLDKNDPRDAVHKKPNPALDHHFKGSAGLPDQDMTERPAAPKRPNPALETSLDKTVPLPNKKPNPQLEATVGKEGSEVAPVIKKPNPQLETSYDKEGGTVEMPIKPPRASLETTLDKDPRPSSAKLRKDLRSHVPFSDTPQSSRGHQEHGDGDLHDDVAELEINDDLDAPKHKRHLSPDRQTSKLAFTAEGAMPAESAPAEKVSQRRQSPVRNKYTTSIPFVMDHKQEQSQQQAAFQPARGHYTYHNKSGVEFGDDGGFTGLPDDTPKSVTVADLPQEKPKTRSPRAVGGKTSIQFG
ncbi:hypothetical protein RI367_006287 [Sorochytrium milnesiophthora]